MKKVLILWLLFVFMVLANTQEDKVCKDTKEKFEQIDYLLNEFNGTHEALVVFNRSNIKYYFENPRTKYKCIEQYKKKWLYLLYKNKRAYLLESLYRRDKDNYLIPLYIGHIARDRQKTKKALEYYNKYIALKKEDIDKDVLKYIKSGGLMPYKSKWAEKLNPSGEIPRDKLKNIFFSLKSKKIFKETYTKELNIDAIGTLYDHNTSDIGSYHVGNFYFDKNETYNITLETTHARDYRVIIDDMLISKQRNLGHFAKKYTFSKGVHKIEIELLNRDVMYNVSFSMTIDQKRYSNKELQSLLKNRNFELYLVNYRPSYKASYRSGGLQLKKETKSPEVTIKKSSKPVVLILQATTKVNWKIKNAQKTKAIIVGRHSALADKLTVDGKNIPIYHAQSSFRAREMMPKNCRCVGAGGMYLCDNSFLRLYDKIEKLFGEPVDGYTYTSKEKFAVPQEQVQIDKLKALKEKISHDKKVCKESKIDKVFKY